MDISIVRAKMPKEARALAIFDNKAFPNTEDHVPPSYYKEPCMRSYWLMLNTRRVGCTSIVQHHTFGDTPEVLQKKERGTLYVVSTAIAQKYQGMGLANIMKAWQIAYAQKNEFLRIVTNARKSNAASIALNKKFGFVVTGVITEYYPDSETAVLLEYTLNEKRKHST